MLLSNLLETSSTQSPPYVMVRTVLVKQIQGLFKDTK